MRIGYVLRGEKFTPEELLRQAERAEQAGFGGLWLKDHPHRGSHPFVWSMAGALSQRCGLPVTAALACPTPRIHPVVVAQAAATCSMLLHDRFALGLATEAADGMRLSTLQRMDLLTEAVDIIKRLWNGEQVNHYGGYYTVEGESLDATPGASPPVYLSVCDETAAKIAARIGDGVITTGWDADVVTGLDERDGDATLQATAAVCWAPTRDAAQELAGSADIPCGPEPAAHRELLDRLRDNGYDSVHVSNIGPYQRDFFQMYRQEVLPRYV